MNISIIIPTYNENKNIKPAIQELFGVLNRIPDINKVEIIVVDDHSSDDTFDVVKGINDSRVKCLRLSRRCGSHTAIRAGLKEAMGDVLLYISVDGQDDPNCLINMLEKWRNGVQVVWALRTNSLDGPWHLQISAKLFYKLLIWLGGVEGTNINISRANFCLLDRTVIEAINRCAERNTSLFGLIIWLGFNQDFVGYERRQRRYGKSKWNLVSYLGLAKDWIVGFSGLPLTLISIVGFSVTSLSFLYGIYVLINFIAGKSIQNSSLIMLVVLLIGGIQMVMLGIIGEYLWNNLHEARRRPLFFIEKRSDGINKDNRSLC